MTVEIYLLRQPRAVRGAEPKRRAARSNRQGASDPEIKPQPLRIPLGVWGLGRATLHATFNNSFTGLGFRKCNWFLGACTHLRLLAWHNLIGRFFSDTPAQSR